MILEVSKTIWISLVFKKFIKSLLNKNVSSNTSIRPYSCQLLWLHHIIHHLHLYSFYVFSDSSWVDKKVPRFTLFRSSCKNQLFHWKLLNVSNTLEIYVQGQFAVKFSVIFLSHSLFWSKIKKYICHYHSTCWGLFCV